MKLRIALYRCLIIFTILFSIQSVYAEKKAAKANGLESDTDLRGFKDTIQNCGILITKERRMKVHQDRKKKYAKSHSATVKNPIKKNIVKDEIGCCDCIPITQEDFGPNRNATYSITVPGVYKFSTDVEFHTPSDYVPAIEILADNVVLELCGHTLSQGNDTSNGHGIRLGEGYFASDPNFVVSNVTIRDGTIRDFTGIGIFAFNSTYDGTTNQAEFQDLRFHKLNVLDCGSLNDSTDFASGIDLDGGIGSFILFPVDPNYRNVEIEECKIERAKGNGAVLVYGVENCFVTDSTANNVKAEFSPLQEVFGWNFCALNLEMFRCQGNGARNFTSTPASLDYIGQTGGIAINDSINVLIKDSQFNDFFAENDYIVNNNLSINFNDVYEDCQFNGAAGGAGAILVFGVHRSSASAVLNKYGKGSRYTRCEFNQASISPDNPGGFAFSSIGGFVSITYSDCLFEDCRFLNHDVKGNLGYKAFGAAVGSEPYQDFPQNGVGPAVCQTFRDCIAADITGGNGAGGILSIVVDYNRTGLQRAQTDIIMQRCIAERIRTISDDPVTTIGLGEGAVFQSNNPIRPQAIYTYFDKMRNLQISDSRVSNVHALGSPRSSNSAGIFVYAVQNAEVTNNSVVDCDRGILFTGTNTLVPNAFQLAANLADSISEFPIPINLTSVPSSTPLQTFVNLTNGTSVNISPSLKLDTQDNGTIDLVHDFIWPVDFNLTALKWKPGDKITYDCHGGQAIGGLTCGTTYNAIVYSPGFVERGLVKSNNVTGCSVTGFQDDRKPCTSTLWINNIAYCNGKNHKDNYKIHWGSSEIPVAKGTLSSYAKPSDWTENISTICGKSDCKKKKKHQKHHRCRH